jgi:hypothetical protein
MIKLTISLHWPPLAMLPGTPARCSASGEVDEASATAAIQLATAREQESKKMYKTTSRKRNIVRVMHFRVVQRSNPTSWPNAAKFKRARRLGKNRHVDGFNRHARPDVDGRL